jgi:hypothetical protein
MENLELAEKLKKFGFSRIVIADDNEANINAAKGLEEVLPGIDFEFYADGLSVVNLIPERHSEIGLILTDRSMETPDAGLDVVRVGWDYYIPTILCTGGLQTHRNLPKVTVWPIELNKSPDGLEKNSIEFWINLVHMVCAAVDGRNSILSTFMLCRSALKGKAPSSKYSSYGTGEQAEAVAKGFVNSPMWKK